MKVNTVIALLVVARFGLASPDLAAGATRYDDMHRAVHRTSSSIYGRKPSTLRRASKVWEARRKAVGRSPARKGLTTVDDHKKAPPKVHGKPTGRGYILIDRRPPHQPFFMAPARNAKKGKTAGEGADGSSAATATGGRPQGWMRIMRTSMRNLIRESLDAPYSTGEVGDNPKTGFKPGAYVAYLYRQIGRVLPKTPEQLYRTAGVPLVDRHFEPGDLLFFRVRSRKTRKVALFVGVWYGDNFFAYPSFGLKKVVRSDYRRDFWKQRFLGARRVIGTAP